MNEQAMIAALANMEAKSDAGELTRYSAFTKRFFPRLPKIVRNDVKRKIAKRKQRQNPTKENLILAAEDAVKFGL
ncbi:replication protein, partial [Vibrio splendidus]